MQPRQVDAPLRFLTGQRDGSSPRVVQLARRALHADRHATRSTTAPPRLRNRCRDSRRPSSTSLAQRSKAVKNGPAVMTVAGARGQRSRHLPSSCPIRRQQESPLSRREDDAPVTRTSNGSRTRNGSFADRLPGRINFAAKQVTFLARAAGDASPPPKRPRRKRYATTFNFESFFPFPSFSISCNRDREGG
jgi:hypothetical protein